MTMGIAADGSNFTDTVQLSTMQAMVARGLTRWASGMQYPGDPYPKGCAEGQIVSAIAAGVPEIHVYAESTPIAEAWPHVAPWRDHIRRAWLTVEPGSGFETLEAIREGFNELDALDLPERPGIYTSTWALQQLGLYDQMAEFADRDLWWAGYNGQRDLAMRPLAVWQACAIHQFYGADSNGAPDPIFGIPQIDLSYYEEAEEVVTKLGDSAAIAAVLATVQGMSPEIAQQDGQYVGTLSGAPSGYTDYVIRVKEA